MRLSGISRQYVNVKIKHTPPLSKIAKNQPASPLKNPGTDGMDGTGRSPIRPPKAKKAVVPHFFELPRQGAENALFATSPLTPLCDQSDQRSTEEIQLNPS
jgi:hypothetical protein